MVPKFLRAFKASFLRFKTSKSPTCDSVASFHAVSGHLCTSDDVDSSAHTLLIVTPSETMLPSAVEMEASVDYEASREESSVSEYNSSSSSDAESALSSVTSRDPFEEPEYVFACVGGFASEPRTEACSDIPTADIDASLTKSCAIDENVYYYRGDLEDPSRDKSETLEREEARTNPCATRLQQIAPPEIEFDVSADALQSWSWKAHTCHFAIIYTPDRPDDHTDSTVESTEPAVTDISPATPMFSEVMPGVQTDANTLSPSPSLVVDFVPSPAVTSSPSVSDILASADSSLFPSLMGSTRSEEDMRLLLASIPISPSDDYISMMGSTRSEQDMIMLLASIPISPSDDYILGPSDMSVLSAAPEVDAPHTFNGYKASPALHGSPSLIISKPMEEIEEEMTHILAPFSCAGLSTGFEPLVL